MLKNPDFEGQISSVILSMALFFWGIVGIIEAFGGLSLFISYDAERLWPWWVGYAALAASFFMFYATFRIILQRLHQRVYEKKVSKRVARAQFVATLCKLILLFVAVTVLTGIAVVVRGYIIH